MVGLGSKDTSSWVYTLPASLGSKIFRPICARFLLSALPLAYFRPMCAGFLSIALLLAFVLRALLSWAFAAGGIAWKNGRNKRGTVPIPGPRGLPIFGSLLTLDGGLAHRALAALASSRASRQLMAFSLGSAPAVVTSDPQIAREILTSSHFSDRPIKQSAKNLMFSRTIGFASNGTYWRLLRRIASSHLFAPRRVQVHEAGRQLDCASLLEGVCREQGDRGLVGLRKHLQGAALNNIMGCVFGKRYDLRQVSHEAKELKEMVREGFELLGAFNWSDYLPWLSHFYDPHHVNDRCSALVPRVRKLVKCIIEEHKERGCGNLADNADFVDVLLSLEGEEKLQEDDMIAVLWEMIFRGTDTTALLTEWAMAELVLNQDIQEKLQEELDLVVGNQRSVTEADMPNLPYLQAVVKETLRAHPPGPLLSWARMSTSDVQLCNGMVVPAQTTAMVNMWAITHDPSVWEEPSKFKPERFLESSGGDNVDVKGSDLRLAPFGAGRRLCPGRNLGLVTVSLWVAKLAHHFKWVPAEGKAVDLTEVLKLSCEMKSPLRAVAVPRNVGVPF